MRIQHVCTMVMACCAAQAADVSFHPGERVVALGDSITHGGLYHRYLDLFYTTRFPDAPRHFMNAGIGGDWAGGALARLEWDVLAKKPTVVAIMFGMNDVGRALYQVEEPTAEQLVQRQERLDRYPKQMAELVDRIHAYGARVMLLTPSPHDDTMAADAPAFNRVNDGLSVYAEQARRIGAEKDVPVVDFFQPMLELNLARQAMDPRFTLISGDRVHPGPVGHFMMTWLFLKAQGITQPVMDVAVDAGAGSVVRSLNAEVSEFVVDEDGGLRFVCRAGALPFPAMPEVQGAHDLFSFNETFNQERLAVEGLGDEAFLLVIDDVPIRTYTGAELAAGINLALETNTPQHAQAGEVERLWRRKHAVENQLRDIVFSESRLWGTRPRPIVREEMRPLLEAAIAQTRDNPALRSVTVRYEAYDTLKVREDQIVEELDHVIEGMHRAARPLPRTYRLVRDPAI
ncbi:MAG TPA: SGNH/GDSL hydrolase family protein [Kiritimatiellia bacterium]|nr:SGNH/GDSL hydrolase family protein [Kiritimatiellia bacterium]